MSLLTIKLRCKVLVIAERFDQKTERNAFNPTNVPPLRSHKMRISFAKAIPESGGPKFPLTITGKATAWMRTSRSPLELG